MKVANKRRSIIAVLAAAAALLSVPTVMSASASADVNTFPPGTTVVSLTFDDGAVDQVQYGAPILDAHGVKGTYYVNSSRVGAPGYASQAQLTTLAANGHEIGGHTIDHADLPTLSNEDQVRQICDDRVALLKRGFEIRNFAYPFGDANLFSEQTAKGCGYNSARGVGGLRGVTSCQNCPFAETFSPSDLYYVASAPSIKTDTTLDELKGYVNRAEAAGGGWVSFPIHHVCVGCDDVYAMNPALLSSFLDWLAPRQANNTIVRTVNDVIGGAVKPGVGSPPLEPTAPNMVTNESLESALSSGVPSCFQMGGYGTNTFTAARVTDGHSGGYAEQVKINSFTSGDRKLVTVQDNSSCVPVGAPGRLYKISAWIKGTWGPSTPVWIVAYYRNASGVWTYWKTGANQTQSASWKQVTYALPALPAGATGVSFGVAIAGPGTLLTDDYSMVDVTGA